MVEITEALSCDLITTSLKTSINLSENLSFTPWKSVTSVAGNWSFWDYWSYSLSFHLWYQSHCVPINKIFLIKNSYSSNPNSMDRKDLGFFPRLWRSFARVLNPSFVVLQLWTSWGNSYSKSKTYKLKITASFSKEVRSLRDWLILFKPPSLIPSHL